MKERDEGERQADEEHHAYEEVSEEQDDAVIGVALRRSAFVLAALVAVVLLVLFLRSRPEVAGPDSLIAADAPENVPQATAETTPPDVEWTDITSASGVTFVHENGARGERFLPETMGGGAAFFDFDRDRDQDLLLVNSRPWSTASGAAGGARSHLYLNDGTGRFEERAAQLGADLDLYGTGVAIGDVDGDGFPDVFVAAVGANRFLRNRPAADGTRRFVDETGASGLAGGADEWSSSSAFLDFDRDGDLDLFVCNYVRWSPEIDLEINYTLDGTQRAYGPPVNYEGTFPYLYRNEGVSEGGVVRFVEVGAESGLHVVNPATGLPVAKSLGVSPVDLDLDGWTDLVVANDTVANFLFRNLGDGTFEEVGELYGVAYGRDGNATGAMGIDFAQPRNDEDLAFAIGNFANEMTSLYVAQGDPRLFADEAIGTGIGAPSRRFLSFGVFFFDYDLDGRLDLLQANGHLESEIATVDPSQDYRQPTQLFWNAGPRADRLFVEVEERGALSNQLVGRGSAYGDIDLDGDLDVLILQTGDAPLLVRNDQSLGHHWLRVELRGNGRTVSTDAIGSSVVLRRGESIQRRWVQPARGYQSHSELPLVFGLGESPAVDALEVEWSDGTRQVETVSGVDRLVVIEQSDG